MLTLQKVKEARERIGSSVFVSPCSRSDTFSELIDNSVFLKLENLQMTGSYKERGALNKILTLSEAERVRGLIAASAAITLRRSPITPANEASRRRSACP